jgi:hypothetical protein
VAGVTTCVGSDAEQADRLAASTMNSREKGMVFRRMNFIF